MFAVYVITNESNKLSYVGMSKHPKKRFAEHITGAGSKEIRADVLAYGADVFCQQIIEVFENKSDAIIREDYFIRSLGTLAPRGYNIRNGQMSVEERKTKKLKAIILCSDTMEAFKKVKRMIMAIAPANVRVDNDYVVRQLIAAAIEKIELQRAQAVEVENVPK